MRTRIATLLTLLLLLATALATPEAGAVQLEERPTIVCASSILADFTENIVGDLATVEYVLPAGICPAHFDSKPSDVELINSADIIVQLGWEGWLNAIVEASGMTDVPVVKCSGLGEWNYPTGAKAHVDLISEGLVEAMPEHAAELTSNADSYKASIDVKAAELEALVAAEGVVGSRVVCMDWQVDFVEWLGFEVVAHYAPPESLSVEDQLNVTEAASTEGAVMVIDNLQSGTQFGATVASKTGVSHVILTNFPEAIPGAYTYLEMIDYNVDKLVDGAKTFEFKRGVIQDLESQVDDLELKSTVYMTVAALCILLVAFMAVVLLRARSRED